VSDIADALQALAAGERTLDDVEEEFRNRTWPRRVTPTPTTYLDAARAEETDSEVPPEGSFAEVADAYTSGVIDHAQYVRLAEAVVEVMNQQEQSKREDHP
jgi:hypothetical protein